MTVVTKIIKGHPYYYYQDISLLHQNGDRVNDNGRTRIVSTIIGRADLDSKELLKKRQEALQKHFVKVYRVARYIKRVNFKFENKPTSKSTDDLELIRLMYRQFVGTMLPHERESFENVFFLKYVHGTTAIEGNTLSEEEADKLLSTRLTTQNKTLDEALEVANYNDVKKFMVTYRGEVTERLIKNIHGFLMKGVRGLDGEPINAGEYRKRGAKITGIWYKPPAAELIGQLIHYALADYRNGQERNIHPVELTSIFHQKFEEIHPFSEGNGRTGREVLNFMLKRNGFPPIYLTLKHRSEYLNALEEGNRSNYVPLIDFIINRMNATLVYMVSRTSMLQYIKSSDYKNFFLSTADEVMYEKYIKEITHLNQSGELP